jgi:predicted amidohydrolase
MSMRIAVVQQDGNPGRPEEDLEKAIAFARQALDQNADVVLFHKELLLGYTPDLRDLAETADGPTTRALSRNDARLRKSWLLDRALDEQQGSRGHDEVVDLDLRDTNPWYRV